MNGKRFSGFFRRLLPGKDAQDCNSPSEGGVVPPTLSVSEQFDRTFCPDREDSPHKQLLARLSGTPMAEAAEDLCHRAMMYREAAKAQKKFLLRFDIASCVLILITLSMYIGKDYSILLAFVQMFTLPVTALLCSNIIIIRKVKRYKRGLMNELELLMNQIQGGGEDQSGAQPKGERELMP